jgi:hypothetical protein
VEIEVKGLKAKNLFSEKPKRNSPTGTFPSKREVRFGIGFSFSAPCVDMLMTVVMTYCVDVLMC